jgi:hypothetical protein
MISILSAVAAAFWSAWTWQSERQKERDTKRDAMSAQYVNAFIVTTRELQRSIFKILEEDELNYRRTKVEQKGEAASPAAIDILYDLSNFFGWGMVTFRYGPYTRDPHVIEMMAHIGETFENRTRYPGEAFRFTFNDRLALGQTVVRRLTESTHGPVFTSVPRFKFEENLFDAQNEHARLFRNDEVRKTLAAIDRAVAGEPLEGRERLAVLQNLLVDLQAHLEHEEGFRISTGEISRVPVKSKYVDGVVLHNNDVQILHQTRGRIRLGVPRMHTDRTLAARLVPVLVSQQFVTSVRASENAACFVVEYSHSVSQVEFVQNIIATIQAELSYPGLDNYQKVMSTLAAKGTLVRAKKSV